MPFRIELNYTHPDRMHAYISGCDKKLKHGITWKPVQFGEEGELDISIDIPLDLDERNGLNALLLVADHGGNNPTMRAIGNALEAAFVAGITYATKIKKLK